MTSVADRRCSGAREPATHSRPRVLKVAMPREQSVVPARNMLREQFCVPARYSPLSRCPARRGERQAFVAECKCCVWGSRTLARMREERKRNCPLPVLQNGLARGRVRCMMSVSPQDRWGWGSAGGRLRMWLYGGGVR